MKSQRRLALVWGRKFFFSYGLLSLLAVAALFFQHLNPPESILAWFYLGTSYIGHFGLMLMLGFFVLYTPLVWLLPGYYWCRFWAATIISLMVAIVGLDAMIVAQYRWHFYDLLSFKNTLSIEDLLSATELQSVFLGGLFLYWVFLFVIGEKLWRGLQRRFSQTVSNWYLYPIILCFVISNLIHLVADYQRNTELISYNNTFTYQTPLTAKKLLEKVGFTQSVPEIKNEMNSFFYPKEQPKCEIETAKNLVVILVPNWKKSDLAPLDETGMTAENILTHYSSHGQRFDKNYIGTASVKEGLFSFFYSLPPFYMDNFISQKKNAVFLDQLKKTNMESFVLSARPEVDMLGNQISIEKFNSNLEMREAFKLKIASITDKPFAAFTIVNNTSPLELEQTIRFIMEDLISQKKIKTTNIVVTSISSSENQGPMFTLFPNREDQVVSHFSQVIDIAPSIMKDQFKCKNNFKDYSLGENLWENQERNTLYSGTKSDLVIMSFDSKKKELVELEHHDFLKELKVLTFFYKRSR